MNTEIAAEAPTGRLKITANRTKKRTAARPPLPNELFQVGGVSSLSWRLGAPLPPPFPPPFFAEVRRCAAWAFASARLRGRLREGRVSTRPPWVPRCLRRRFFLVFATAPES